MLDRITYLTKMVIGHMSRDRRCCPNCGGQEAEFVSRKALFTTLRRCVSCHLQFRAPTDSEAESHRFYRRFYKQGFTTTLPDPATLDEMKASSFRGTQKDITCYLSDLSLLGVQPDARIFDFGCSWGYGPWQMRQNGYDVVASEINPERAQFAEKQMGVSMVEEVQSFAAKPENAHSFDVFFSSHVIEHVPSPQQVFDLAKQLLNPGGIFLSYTPNGTQAHRDASPSWDRLWGQVHPNYIDDRFLQNGFKNTPCLFASRHDREIVQNLSIPEKGTVSLDLTGYELIFATRV